VWRWRNEVHSLNYWCTYSLVCLYYNSKYHSIYNPLVHCIITCSFTYFTCWVLSYLSRLYFKVYHVHRMTTSG
jgi:hypothetical protein